MGKPVLKMIYKMQGEVHIELLQEGTNIHRSARRTSFHQSKTLNVL